MAVKILSFLGTNEYIKCNYVFEDRIKIKESKYISVAIGEYFLKEKNENVEIIIFCSKEAEERNLLSREFTGNDNKERYIGLKEELDNNINLKEKYKIVKDIPSKFDTKNIRDISNIILNEIDKEDKIIFDITHGPKVLPYIVANIVTDKKEQIEGVYYGALEEIGGGFAIRKMPLEDRNVPVYDLKDLG